MQADFSTSSRAALQLQATQVQLVVTPTADSTTEGAETFTLQE